MPLPSHWVEKKHEPHGAARANLVTVEPRSPDSLGYFTAGMNEGEDILKEELTGIWERLVKAQRELYVELPPEDAV